jgi:putative ABC transport system ATP-binding protein
MLENSSQTHAIMETNKPEDNPVLINLQKLVKVYRTEDVETVALNEVDLAIKRGEFVSIMGPSGCGKSTLLNVVGMIDSPSDGTYHFLEQEVGQLPERKRSIIRKNNLGFVFQSFNLIDELTVYENVELPMLYTNTPSAERKRRVEELLDEMKMMHRRNHFPQQLSGGQQQRVAVARAIVNKPKLILADEPTGNLDSANGDDVMRLLAELNASGTTIVMVTHSQYCAEFGNRVVRMLDGQVVTENVVWQYM